MTMALSAPLQTAIYNQLSNAPSLAGLAGRIFDAAPQAVGDDTEIYVTLGDEIVGPWNTAASTGASHSITIRVYSQGRGFIAAKSAAALICGLLTSEPLALSRGIVISQKFTGAETAREEGDMLRRVDLTFRFIIEDTVE
jgi:hypothetical protein